MHTDSRRLKDVALLLVLAGLALGLAGLLAAGDPAMASNLSLQSPVSPVEQPAPTMAPAAEPAAAPGATTMPALSPEAAESPSDSQPPIPVGVLAGLMVVIGLVALVIGLRRR